MSKRIVMWIVTSLIVSVVMSVGSFTCKGADGSDKVLLGVQHPDSCYLIEPSPIGGISTAADMVSVKPGENQFKFDCNGKEIILRTDIQPEQHFWNATSALPAHASGSDYGF